MPTRVAHAQRHRLEHALRRIDAHDRSLRVVRHHDVAGGADVEVELAVRAHRQELPEVARGALRIEVVDHHLALGGAVELVLDAVVARDAAALGDVQRSLAERDAVRRVQAFEGAS